VKRPRRRHTPEFKAQVALASLQDGNAVHLCADRYGVHPNLVRAWQSRLLDRAALLFERRHAARGRKRRGLEAKAPATL
jgi:transposase-like protein